MTQALNRTSRTTSLTRIPSADARNRRRTVGVSPESSTGRVALITPPGESAVLSPHEARALAQQLLVMAAALDAQHQDVTPLDSRRRTG
jgi:hypothetical protein